MCICIADHTAVTVTFSQYYAEVGPGIPISANRKNCQLTLGVRYVFFFMSYLPLVDKFLLAFLQVLPSALPLSTTCVHFGISWERYADDSNV